MPAGGEVDGEKNEFAEVSDDGEPVSVESVTESKLHALGLLLGVETYAALTLLFRRREERMVPGNGPDLFRKLLFVGFGLVKAEDIGIFAAEPIEKSFLVDRPETVNVPG